MGGFFTSFGPVEQMGEVAWGAMWRCFGDPANRDGGLVAESQSDFHFDRSLLRVERGNYYNFWFSTFLSVRQSRNSDTIT